MALGTIADLYLRVRADLSRFRRDVDDDADAAGTRAARTFTQRMKEGLGGLAGVVGGALVGAKVVSVIRDSIAAASDLAETQSKVQTIFGTSSTAIFQFGQNAAKALGQSKQSALDAAATFAIFGKSAGLSGQALVDFSTQMTSLATDLASFNNTSPEDAIIAIGAALRGESEPIRAYGVLLDDATLRNRALQLGLIKTTKDALTPQNKVLAAQAEILAQTKVQQGDFARTSAGLANQQRILTAEWANAKTTLGQQLLPAVLAFVRAIGSSVDFIKQNHQWLVPLVAVLGGFAAVVWTVNAAVTSWAAITAAANAVHLVQLGRMIANNTQLAIYLIRIGAVRAATAIWTGIQWLLNTALTANPIGIVIVAIAALVAAIIIAYKNSETFRNVVQAVWGAIKVAIGAVVSWFVGTVWPSLKQAYDQLAGAAQFMWKIVQFVWTTYKDYIGLVWTVVHAVFQAMVSFVTVTIPGAFKAGVDFVKGQWQIFQNVINGGWMFVKGIFDKIIQVITVDVPNKFREGVAAAGRFWSGIQELVRGPAKWIVDHAINPLINAFNAVSKVVGGGHIDPISFATGGVVTTGGAGSGLIRAFARGGLFDGQLPGAPSVVDNMLARGPGGKPIALAGGEFVVNAMSTKEWLPLLEQINKRSVAGLTPRGEGIEASYAIGGIVGDVIGAFTDPAKWIRDKLAGALNNIPGAGTFHNILVGMGNKLIGSVVDFIKNHVFAGGGPGGGGNPGTGQFTPQPYGWPPRQRHVLSPNTAAAAQFVRNTWHIPVNPDVGRNDPFDHPWGKATDNMTSWFTPAGRAIGNAVAAWFVSNPRVFGTKYVIWNKQVTSGSGWHAYSGDSTHQDHVHVSFFDKGGQWPSGTLGFNNTGRTEVVSTAASMDQVVDLLGRLIEAVERVAPGVGRELNGSAVGMRQLARAR